MAKSGTSYGIGVSNVFDLLQDENEEMEAKKAPVRMVPLKKPVENKVAEDRGEGGQGRGKGSRGRGRRFLPGEGGPAEPLGEKPSDRPAEKGDRVRNRENMHVRSGKRNFDRRSGTGRGKEVQKEGAGRGNWGSNNDEIVEGEEKLQEEAKAEGKEEDKTGEEPQEEKAGEPEEAPVKTLAEFREEMQKQKENLAALPKPRAAGEGEDPSKWKDYVPLKKNLTEESPKEKKEKKKEAPKEATKEAKAEPVAAELLGFRLPRPDTGRGGRGGRGRGGDRAARRGGGGGRGGGRGSGAPAGTEQIKVEDTSQFPSLKTVKA